MVAVAVMAGAVAVVVITTGGAEVAAIITAGVITAAIGKLKSKRSPQLAASYGLVHFRGAVSILHAFLFHHRAGNRAL